MIINVIGSGDNRPVIYTLLKICQCLGDVLLVSPRDYIYRLSNTEESLGHYQNILVAQTTEGIDDFYTDFQYDISDFSYTIVENLLDAKADLTIYVKGLDTSVEEDVLEYVENYVTIDLYNPLVHKGFPMLCIEEFEALRDLCSMPESIASEVCHAIAKAFAMPERDLVTIAMNNPTKAPKPKFEDRVERMLRRLRK